MPTKMNKYPLYCLLCINGLNIFLCHTNSLKIVFNIATTYDINSAIKMRKAKKEKKWVVVINIFWQCWHNKSDLA